jgi:hypothetical protein
VSRPVPRYARDVAGAYQRGRWLQAVAPGYQATDEEGEIHKVSASDHAELLLAEFREAADALGLGLRTLPFVTIPEGVVVQAKPRASRSRKGWATLADHLFQPYPFGGRMICLHRAGGRYCTRPEHEHPLPEEDDQTEQQGGDHA